MQQNLRLDGIDILRGVAVTGVIIYHFYVLLGLMHLGSFAYVHAFGLLGVPLFFIISGYLIYKSIHRNIDKRGEKKGLINYFLHRLFRILPAYYFNLFFVLMLAALMLDGKLLYSTGFIKQILSNLTFTSYFIHKSSGFGFNGAYWTLNIEMLWYLIAPLIFLFAKQTKILIALALLSFLYLWGLEQGFLDSIFGLDNTAKYYELELFYLSTQLPGQINYFIAGILIYKYAISSQSLQAKSIFILVIVLFALYVGLNGHFGISTSFLTIQLFTLFVATLLFILLYATKIKGFFFLEWIGKISYSLYLWHMPILFVLKKTSIFSYLSIPASAALFTAILLSISTLSYYLIEEGGFELRKKIEAKLKRGSTL